MKNIFFIICFLLIHSCSPGIQDSVSADWLIPKDRVFDGGPGKDGIPSIQNPEKISFQEASFLDDDDLVVLYAHNDEIHIYPHKILDWHEIINDRIEDIPITISYCPLTGSAIGLNGAIRGTTTSTFGVSGLLYNSNLIMYDRLTDSYWSQMKNLCVAGALQGDLPKNEIIAETTFKTAKEMFAEGMVVSNKTGIYQSSQYNIYPYGSYKSSNSLIFPVEHEDGRFHKKERVLGIFDGQNAKAYPFSLFADSVSLIIDEVGNEKIIVIGDSNRNYIVAFKRYWQNAEQELSFTTDLSGTGETIFQDNMGNKYNILGQVTEGPDLGKRLESIHSYIAFWFSFAAFYPDIIVYQ